MEAFDPHEPWDPPRRFLEKYLSNPSGPTWSSPPYDDIDIPEEGIKRMRANYFAESECVDYWLGKIFQSINELGLFDNSMVVFMSDHGALLGEQGQFCKGPERIRRQVTHLPLLLRLPNRERAGQKVGGIVQIPDYMPSLLKGLGLDSPPRVTAKDFWPMVNGQTHSIHEFAVMAYGWIGAVRTSEWNFSAIWNANEYPGRYEPQLYSREKDPDVVSDLTKKMNDYIASGVGLTKGSFNAPVGVGTPTY